jgi:hypothetical protein
MPMVVGTVAAVVVMVVWWPARDVAMLHDEAAYLLQAELLARGQFAGPAPPVPAAAVQAAVLVEPVLAPKPMPGHAVALLPGTILGMPWLAVAGWTVVAAGLLFALVRRLTDGVVALLAVALWLTAPGVLRWQGSYLSEVTSTALLLVAWYALHRWWREDAVPWWLAGVGGAFGWLAITRPLTALCLVVPTGACVLYLLARKRHLHRLWIPVVAGLVPLLLVPIQSRAVSGSWSRTPWGMYSARYMPWDRPGFGVPDLPAEQVLPADLAGAMAEFEALHRVHRPDRLPGILADRLGTVARQQGSGWRGLVLPVAIGVGLVVAWPWTVLVVGAVMSQFIGYLAYAHHAHWTVYYAELIPLLAALAAVGIGGLASRLRGRRDRQRDAIILGLTVGVGLLAIPAASMTRRLKVAGVAPWRQLAQSLATAPEARRLVFVRHDTTLDAHVSLVRNSADARGAGVVLVRDLGPTINRQVADAHPGRSAWIYDPASGRLEPVLP